jgi:16S rRNA G966 N2-methylase RsmD
MFDIKYGVNTCGHKSLLDIDGNHFSKSFSIGYEPTPVQVIEKIFGMLPVNYPEFTFIDFGSGKGRVLLCASEYDFAKIIGIEIDRALHHIAVKNLQNWKSRSRKCFNIEPKNLNAIEFELPLEPLVIFFYTPFLGAFFERIVKKIEVYLKRTTSQIYIIYIGVNKNNPAMLRKLNLDYRRIDIKYITAVKGKPQGHIFYRNAVGSTG